MPRRLKWSRQIIVDFILKRHSKKLKLNSNYIQKYCSKLYQAALKYYGSWKKAIEAAGLKYYDVRVTEHACPVWSKEKIIAIIKQRHKKKLPLNSDHIQTKSKLCNLYAASVKHFGSWKLAIHAAGLDYSKLRKKGPMRSWSKVRILTAIISRSANGLSIRGNTIYLKDRGLYQAAKRYFGGWAEARVLAGFEPVDPVPWKIWDENTLSTEILRLHRNGVALNIASILKSPHANLQSAAKNVFGSWAQAIRAVGLNYSKIKQTRLGWWTKPRVLMCIQALEKRGIRLSCKAIQKSHGALFGAATGRFKSWDRAVEAAGISYRAHCRVWSTKAWLRRMETNEYQTTLVRAETYAKRRNSI